MTISTYRSLLLGVGLVSLTLLSQPVHAAVERGDTAPNFSLLDLDNNRHILADYQGKTVVLNFFATWCGPCHQEAPDFLEMAHELGSDSVKFFQVSSAERTRDYATWVSNIMGWRAQYGIDVPILVDNTQAVASSYIVEGGYLYLPNNIVIGKDGKVLYRDSGFNPSRIRSAIAESEAISFDPPGVDNVAAADAGGTSATISWSASAGAGSSFTNYVVSWGTSETSLTNVVEVGASATSVRLDLPGTGETFYAAVHTRNASGQTGTRSAPVKFGFKPVMNLITFSDVYSANSNLILNYRIDNWGEKDEDLSMFVVLELAGSYYFYTAQHGFTDWPAASYRYVGPNASEMANIFSVTFGPEPLPQMSGAFYAGLLSNTTATWYDIDSAAFRFE